MVNWDISDLKELNARLKQSLADFEAWEARINSFPDEDGSFDDFKELLEAGKYYDTTR